MCIEDKNKILSEKSVVNYILFQIYTVILLRFRDVSINCCMVSNIFGLEITESAVNLQRHYYAFRIVVELETRERQILKPNLLIGVAYAASVTYVYALSHDFAY